MFVSETDSECLSLTAELNRVQASHALSHTHTHLQYSRKKLSQAKREDTCWYTCFQGGKDERGRSLRPRVEILDWLSLGWSLRFLFLY